VQFIVRATDHALKNHLDIPQGLRDNSKTTIKIQVPAAKQTKGGGRKTVSADKEIHRLQILDPATGTGTFLAEIIRHIHQSYAAQQGLWQSYAEQDLIPRLNGFELMMASYAVAHLKLDLVLQETGYRQPEKPRRFNVFLADSLEEHHPDTNTLFAQWLAAEANEANAVKRDTPVMVVLGNPPYYGESQNKGAWIMDLMEDYKQEPDGSGRLKERNSKWLNNDYIKFIRAAQHYIAKNGSGILAFINSNSYLDGLIHRGMRHNLIQTYDHIYILNLHGNSKKKETAPDGGKDENVFDITEGVCINLFIKTPGKKKKDTSAQIHYCDLYGRRQDKYAFLQHETLDSIPWQTLVPQAPDYFFVPQQSDNQTRAEWHKGIELDKLFPVNSVGIVTAKDSVLIAENKKNLLEQVSDYYGIEADEDYARKISYRPFDTRWVYFDTDKVERSREKVMQHLSGRENIGLIVGRQGQVVGNMPWNLSFVISNQIIDFNVYYRGGGQIFPLYLYSEQGSLNNGFIHRPNINPAQLQSLCNQTGLAYRPAPDAEPQTLPQSSLRPKEVPVGKTSKAKTDAADFNAAQPDSFTPETLLDYIYAVLHSPAYRRRYAEFLKSGFPRIPNPENRSEFLRLAAIGSELRQWHTLQHPKADIACFITAFDSPEPDMQVDKPRYTPDSDTPETGSVYWNKTTCIRKVPAAAWQFYIGGYQPAQKWLKDRKGQTLTAAGIEHYQKIILALTRTVELMQQIDEAAQPM
jgi:adenine specific DNA methyltransferase